MTKSRESLVRLVRVAASALLMLAMAPGLSRGEGSSGAAPDSTIDTTVGAGEADAEQPRRQLVKWNEYDGPVSTIRFGFGFGYDLATYAQDEESKEQLEMDANASVRDFRFILSGRFKTKRPLSWTLGYMYDGVEDVWRFRKTGLYIGVPELSGRFFVGREKEGYSMVKVMNGYQLLTMERATELDAFVPILADGVKYEGYYTGPRVHVSLGWFMDELSEDEKFATSDQQTVVRLGWLPILSEDNEELLDIAVMVRDTEPDEGSLQVRSRPEDSKAPYVVDTGKFPADHARVIGIEAFYRKGPWLVGSEYHWQDVSPVTGGDVLFHGGNVVASWIITGETRPYNTTSACFKAVSPDRTVFSGGPGAWEAVLHLSYLDLDSGMFQGGKFWRLTPMVNWHLSDNVRMDFAYGYGELDRFGLNGGTQFFQGRIQFTL
jgi:phosphate-selective porin OprO and OprP